MNNPVNRVGAVIVAAGTSNRMAGIDKVFAHLQGVPILVKVVDVFERCLSVNKIVIVLSADNIERGKKLINNKRWLKVSSVCTGGTRRQDSVKEGLHNLADCDWVIIHDGARPCITTEIIEKGLLAARKTGAAIAAVPVKDTIKVVSRTGIIQQTPERDKLWIAQTPQVFKYKLIMEAYSKYTDDVTDDSMLIEKMGNKVEVYMGSYQNIKITTPEDLEIVELFLKTL